MGRPRATNCEICGRSHVIGKRGEGKLCFDHDHKTGKARGWLCTNCNKAIGLAQDDINILAAMISYLERHKNGEAQKEE